MRRHKPPSDAVACSACGGRGHFFIKGDTAKKHCYQCGGAGWVFPQFYQRFSPHPEAKDHEYKPPVKGAKVGGQWTPGIH